MSGCAHDSSRSLLDPVECSYGQRNCFLQQPGNSKLSVPLPNSHQEQRCKQPTRCNNFSFINLFKSALHVSGDKFSHPQEHLLTVYTSFGTMHRHCCRPASASVLCTKSCQYSQKVLLRMCEFVARNM